MLIKDQFGINENLQTSPIPQTSFLVGTFFTTSYSKTALGVYCPNIYTVPWILTGDRKQENFDAF